VKEIVQIVGLLFLVVVFAILFPRTSAVPIVFGVIYIIFIGLYKLSQGLNTLFSSKDRGGSMPKHSFNELPLWNYIGLILIAIGIIIFMIWAYWDLFAGLLPLLRKGVRYIKRIIPG